MESQITYSSGTLNGEYKRWKYQGQLVSQDYYKNGVKDEIW
jgi:antitoxin component YwqK of YwqJK toxin-antitoxin module